MSRHNENITEISRNNNKEPEILGKKLSSPPS